MNYRINYKRLLYVIGSVILCLSCNITKDSNVPSIEDSRSSELTQLLKKVYEANDTICFRSIKTANVENYTGQKLNYFFTEENGRNVIFACHCHLKYGSGHLYNVPLLEGIFDLRKTDFQKDELSDLLWFITDYVGPVGDYYSIDVIRKFIAIDACESEYSPYFSNDHMDMSFGYVLYTSGIGPYLLELELNQLFDQIQNLKDVPDINVLDESSCSYTKYRAKQLNDLFSRKEIQSLLSAKRSDN